MNAASHLDDRRPLRIAVVSETFPPEVNGVARTIGTMVDELRGRGHSIQLVRPRQHKHDVGESDRGLETLLKPGLPLPRYQELRMGLPAKRALLAAWKARAPDVVQVVTEGPLGASALAAAKKLGIPVVSEFHTNFHSYSKHYGLGLFTNLVAGYLRRLHNRADRTLVPTEEMKEQLTAAGYRSLAVVGRGIDLAMFDPARRSAELRQSWGAGDNDVVVLYVGRLAPEKNLHLFMQATQAMRAVAPKLRTVLVGDGPERGALQAAGHELVFAGMRRGADLAAHYASADVFLFPSLTETFGNVTTEAMASRLGVVAFDYAAARQYIRSGSNGLLAPFGNAAAFVEAAQEIVADAALRERLRTAARAIAQTLAWPRVVDDLEAILRDTIARVRRASPQRPPSPVVNTDHAPL